VPTPSEELAAQITPVVKEAAKSKLSSSRFRFIPGVAWILSLIIPLVVRWVIEWLIARYGQAAGEIIGGFRAGADRMFKPEVVEGVDKAIALCNQPVSSFEPTMKAMVHQIPRAGSPYR
jgi:hypothetical protein